MVRVVLIKENYYYNRERTLQETRTDQDRENNLLYGGQLQL